MSEQGKDFAGERGPDFAAKREAYEAARTALFDMIDAEPDKTIPVSEYRAKLDTAQAACNAAHEAMLAAWEAPLGDDEAAASDAVTRLFDGVDWDEANVKPASVLDEPTNEYSMRLAANELRRAASKFILQEELMEPVNFAYQQLLRGANTLHAELPSRAATFSDEAAERAAQSLHGEFGLYWHAMSEEQRQVRRETVRAVIAALQGGQA